MPIAESTSESVRPLTILMTEGSSNSARQALYALGPQHTIDVIDPSPLCQCRFSRFVRRWYRCPPFGRDPRSYLTYLGQRLRRERYDVLFPTHEEIYLLSRVAGELSQLTSTAMPEFYAVDQLHSKVRFLALLDELQIPHPDTAVVTSRQEIEQWTHFPSYLKQERGTAGQGVVLLRDRNELLAAVQRFESFGLWCDGTRLLLQRPAMGLQSAARGVFQRGELVAFHMNELRQRGVGGAADARTSCHHPVVVEQLRQLGRRLKWHGALFTEYFFDAATQTPYYIEADPRIGDTANATLSGVNICERWIDVALDRPLRPQLEPPLPVKSHAGLLVLLSKGLQRTSRRRLIADMWQQWRHTCVYEDSQDELTRPREDWLSLLPWAWVAGRLLFRPAAAERIIRSTVQNYALTADSVHRIRDWPADELAACLRGNH